MLFVSVERFARYDDLESPGGEGIMYLDGLALWACSRQLKLIGRRLVSVRRGLSRRQPVASRISTCLFSMVE